jgi:nicotinamide mononucleotide transporter
MQWIQVLELTGAVFSVVYSLLLMKEKMIGWWFGIVASFVSMWVFYQTHLYAQAFISIYFAGIGFYGLWYWKKAKANHIHIQLWQTKTHVVYILLFSLLAMVSFYLFKRYTNSANPMFDSFITLFGLLASIKEARKILSSWVYWFVINAGSVVLYYQEGLFYYAAIMVVYTLICIPGYLSWLNIYRRHKQP